MKPFRPYLLMLLALTLAVGAKAQHTPGRQLTTEEVEQRADSDTSRLEVHGSLFAGFYAGWGRTISYTGAAPTLTYQLKDNLWLSGTVFAIGGTQVPSLAPYRCGAPAPYNPGQMGLLAYGGTVSLQGVTKNDNRWGVHLTVIDDRAGLFTPFMMDPFYHFNLWNTIP